MTLAGVGEAGRFNYGNKDNDTNHKNTNNMRFRDGKNSDLAKYRIFSQILGQMPTFFFYKRKYILIIYIYF